MSTFTTALGKMRNYFRRARIFLLTWMVSVLALTIFIV